MFVLLQQHPRAWCFCSELLVPDVCAEMGRRKQEGEIPGKYFKPDQINDKLFQLMQRTNFNENNCFQNAWSLVWTRHFYSEIQIIVVIQE